MCFYINSKHPDKKKTEKDITCYKILKRCRSIMQSIVQSFEYVQGRMYLDCNALNIERGEFGANVINIGYHSYSNKQEALHTYNAVNKLYYNTIIVKCIIPKGSYYYYDSQRHQYVSDKIKIIDIIK